MSAPDTHSAVSHQDIKAKRTFFAILLHFFDNQQTGLKPMLLFYLPAVLSGRTLFHTSLLLPLYSLITLLLEVLI